MNQLLLAVVVACTGLGSLVVRAGDEAKDPLDEMLSRTSNRVLAAHLSARVLNQASRTVALDPVLQINLAADGTPAFAHPEAKDGAEFHWRGHRLYFRIEVVSFRDAFLGSARGGFALHLHERIPKTREMLRSYRAGVSKMDHEFVEWRTLLGRDPKRPIRIEATVSSDSAKTSLRQFLALSDLTRPHLDAIVQRVSALIAR